MNEVLQKWGWQEQNPGTFLVPGGEVILICKETGKEPSAKKCLLDGSDRNLPKKRGAAFCHVATSNI